MENIDCSSKKLAYLSGAPRVSTHPDAATSGPRAHILGVMRGFEENGWKVESFIAGNYVPEKWVIGEESERALRSSPIKRLAADLVRLWLGFYNRKRVVRRFFDVDWAYERYGVFQALGRGLQRRGVPWIIESNGLMYIESVKDRSSVALQSLAEVWEKKVYQQCDALVCISKALRDLVAEKLEVDRQKTIVVPVAVDTQRFNPQKVQAKNIWRSPTIGFVGTFVGWQAVDTLIEAVAELLEEGIEYSVVLVGDGAFRSTWEGLAEKLGVSGRVSFTGRVPFSEVPSYIQGFDLTFSGQKPLGAGVMYGSPSKIYEYMAMAKPVIASDSFEDSGTLIRDGETGFVFEAGNKESLKSALRRAYQLKEGWQKMGIKAREVVIAHHSWQARVKEMIPQIEEVLRRKYGSAYPARRKS